MNGRIRFDLTFSRRVFFFFPSFPLKCFRCRLKKIEKLSITVDKALKLNQQKTGENIQV